jgi:hypothetical protein
MGKKINCFSTEKKSNFGFPFVLKFREMIGRTHKKTASPNFDIPIKLVVKGPQLLMIY